MQTDILVPHDLVLESPGTIQTIDMLSQAPISSSREKTSDWRAILNSDQRSFIKRTSDQFDIGSIPPFPSNTSPQATVEHLR